MGKAAKKKLILGILGSTRGTDLQAIIGAVESGCLCAEIAIVASDRENSFILERAKNHGIPAIAFDYRKFSDRESAEKAIAAEFKKRGVELVLLIGFMKILTPYFIGKFRRRIWNIHPSLLPKYAGGMNMGVHEEVLKNNEKETGCTLHEVSEEVDKGRVIMQEKCPVSAEDTPESLKEKVQTLEQACLVRAIGLAAEGKIMLG